MAVLAFALTCGCEQGAGTALHVVVPSGFVGVVRMEGWVRGGLDAEAGRIVVPADGVLRFERRVPVTRPRSWTASYDDGRVLPMGWRVNEVGNDVVALRPVGWVMRERAEATVYLMVVGTAADATAAFEKWIAQ